MGRSSKGIVAEHKLESRAKTATLARAYHSHRSLSSMARRPLHGYVAHYGGRKPPRRDYALANRADMPGIFKLSLKALGSRPNIGRQESTVVYCVPSENGVS